MQGVSARPQDFERDVMPVYNRLARKVRLDDERQAVGLALCWYHWSRRKEDYAPGHWARIAVRKVWAGRDLPIDANSQRDVWAQLHRIEGAGMDGLADRKPGPAREAEAADWQEFWHRMLTARQAHVVDLLLSGLTTEEVARKLGCTPTRVSQIRREVATIYYGWDA